MCEYCDEKALPCLMCGRACMEYQLDRTRCRGCATAHRLPDVWPVFRFCPYCGRDLGENENQNENQNQGENEMATEKYRWTKEADDTVRAMLESGRTVADICDALGITDKQLSNRVSVLRRSDETFPRLNRGERVAEDCEEVCEPEVKLEPKGELNPLEQEMARMIEEKEEELQKARQEARWFQDKLDREIVEGERLRKKLAEKDRIIVKMVAEIYGEV